MNSIKTIRVALPADLIEEIDELAKNESTTRNEICIRASRE